jgi:hypothetical protein
MEEISTHPRAQRCCRTSMPASFDTAHSVAMSASRQKQLLMALLSMPMRGQTELDLATAEGARRLSQTVLREARVRFVVSAALAA